VGLGLSICKKIVEVFDGEIFIDNDYKRGTKFVFRVKTSDGSPSPLKELDFNEDREEDNRLISERYNT
jgi:K+-sensing histidine kinase KdpD